MYTRACPRHIELLTLHQSNHTTSSVIDESILTLQIITNPSNPR